MGGSVEAPEVTVNREEGGVGVSGRGHQYGI